MKFISHLSTILFYQYANKLPPPPTIPSLLQKSKIAYSYWFAVLASFPRAHRYTLGHKIDGYFLEMLEIIFLALYLPPEQKISRLNFAIAKLDGIKFFAQIAWENKCLPTDKFGKLSEQLAEIGRMLGGWKKGLEKKTPLK